MIEYVIRISLYLPALFTNKPLYEPPYEQLYKLTACLTKASLRIPVA